MKYIIQYTDKAKEDLRDIYKYISEELLVPDTAKLQFKRIIKAVRSLEQFPFRHSLYRDEPWKSKGLRLFPIDNFIIFYLPDEKKRVVDIVRIMFGGRNVVAQLNDK